MSRAPVSLLVVAAAVFGVGVARSAPHELDATRGAAGPSREWIRVRVSAFDQGTHAFAINDLGQILGVLGDSSFVVWRRGSVHDLGVAVDNLSLAGGLNERGEVVGAAWESRLKRTLAFRWAKGKKRSLGVLERDAVYRVDDGYSVAYDINRRGQIVGESGNEFRERAFLWDGRMRALPPDSRWHSSAAFAINDAGEVVGSTGSSSFQRAAAWRRGRLTVLPSLGGASAAQDLNERGQIVGWSRGMDGRDHAVLWEHGRIRVLAAGFTVARAINDAGVIVGSCGDAACVWENGRLTNFGTVGDTARAVDINDKRQIVGEVIEDCQGGCTPATAVYLWASRS